MANSSEAKRRRTQLKAEPSDEGELLLSASSRVTSPEDIIEGRLLPKLALENMGSFKSACPSSSVCLGLRPGSLQEPLVLKWGSCCSGSEGAHFVVAAVQQAIKTEGCDIEFDHAFSCESNKQKRLWITNVLQSGDVFDPTESGGSSNFGCVFCDIGDMNEEQAACDYHRRKCPVPSVDLLLLGTSCKDLSRANGHVDRSKPVFAETTSRGGSAQTFHGFVEYCKSHGPTMIVYENVDSIDDKISANAENNLSILMKTMTELGYEGQKIMTDSQQFGLPCRRRRLYILFLNLKSPKLCVNLASSHKIFRKVRTLVTACMRTPPCAKTCYLRDSNETQKAILSQRLSEMQSLASKRDEKKAVPNTWVEKHMAHADQLGVRWASPVPNALSQNPWFMCLTKREGDALRLSRVEGPSCEFRNLSQSVGRINTLSHQTSGKHVGPTMLPGQVLWLESQERPMVGEEALIFQGFPILPMMKKVLLPESCSGNGFLQDLAGNAMALPVLMAVLQAGLASVDWVVPLELLAEEEKEEDPDVATALAAVAQLAG